MTSDAPTNAEKMLNCALPAKNRQLSLMYGPFCRGALKGALSDLFISYLSAIY